MKSMFKSFSMLAIAACAGMSFVACSDAVDYYDPEKAEELTKATYEANFIRKFGQVTPNKSWDLSSFSSMKSTRAGEEITITPTTGGLNFGTPVYITQTVKDGTEWKTVENAPYPTYNVDLFTNVVQTFPDGEEHSGSPAVLVAPANSFTIYPICTTGGYQYDMYVKVGTADEVKVFSKNWSGFPEPYFNGCVKNGTSCVMGGVTINAPIGTPISIYLKGIDANKDEQGNPVYVGTGTGSAIIIDTDERPAGVPKEIMPDNAMIKYVGIEDQWNVTDQVVGGDHDYNDLILMIIGNPFTPEENIVEDEYYDKKVTVQKRYMVEDLGTLDDFDFNDVVVDVKDVGTQRMHIHKINGVIVSEEPVGEETHEQSAIVRCLGGTIDFDLTIGNTIWSKSTYRDPFEMWNTGTPLKEVGPDGHTVYDGNSIVWNEETYKFKVDNWIPNENNITVTVRSRGNNGVQTPSETLIRFPKPGEIPVIIATDVTEKWMVERIEIPAAWCK